MEYCVGLLPRGKVIIAVSTSGQVQEPDLSSRCQDRGQGDGKPQSRPPRMCALHAQRSYCTQYAFVDLCACARPIGSAAGAGVTPPYDSAAMGTTAGQGQSSAPP
jgi:hypothetical protein